MIEMADATVIERPRPYWVDQPTHKVQTLEMDGDRPVLILHEFAALNSGNEGQLHEREKKTERVTLKLTKGRFRPKQPKEDEANRAFYRFFIRGGGFRPNFLPPMVVDLGTVPSEAHELYEKNGDGLWHAGFFPLTVEQMRDFDVERMEAALERWFMCKGEVVASGRSLKDVSFMFDKGGVITVRLLIGDFEKPAYRLKLLFRRPEQTRRAGFRDEFAYNVDHTKGEQGKVETIINLKQGIGFTDEHFLGVSTEPDTKPDGTVVHYSPVVFTDTRTIEERLAAGETPRPVSAVQEDAPAPQATEDGKGGPDDPTGATGEPALVPYTEAMRSRFLAAFHPMYKVEAAATAIGSFKNADRE